MLPYSKYSGAGNSFLFFDNRKKVFPFEKIPSLCTLEKVDGIILLEEQLRMRIFNADGSEAEMCGNGLRCFIRFLADLGIKRPFYHVETGAGILEGRIVGEEVAIKMSAPSPIKNVTIENLELHFLNTGVPHAVQFVDDVETVDVENLGHHIRAHPYFAPAGTNATFASCFDGILHLRTYERGVERETLACGTGAVAVALAAAKKFELSSPLTLLPTSKEKLTVSFQRNNEEFTNIILTGPAKKISQGSLTI